MIRAFCSFNDFMLLSLWKQVFNSLHHKLIRLKPIIFLENRALCAKIISFTLMLAPTSLTASAQSMTFGRLRHKIFYTRSVILAALLHFRKRASHVVGMDLYAILLNACIYKRVYIKYTIRLIWVFALYFLYLFFIVYHLARSAQNVQCSNFNVQ